MSVYPLAGLHPTHAALLFCTSSPRNLTCAEMGPKASLVRSVDENMRQFAIVTCDEFVSLESSQEDREVHLFLNLRAV